MPNVVLTCELVDGCVHMMEYKLIVFRNEEEVMEKIDKELSDLEILESILEEGIGCIKPRRNTEKVISGKGTREMAPYTRDIEQLLSNARGLIC
ncbi:hypothetical protein L7F22_030311 [Adiantum nelumboides]|nr:hypothetical protein [Adiantum nelumboides]